MKKAAAIMILFMALILTGCNKAIPAEEAGELLIERLIYQNQEAEFADSFKDGQALGKELDGNAQDFEDGFISGLSSTGTSVSKKDAGVLTEELLKQMRAKTSYKIVEIKETKEGATLSYFITGLDLVNAMKEMTRTLVKDSIENSEKEQTDQELLESTLSILTERIKVIKIENETIEMSVKLGKEKGKWYIPNDQKDTISNLFMAFISGTEENEELDEALNEVIDEVITELLEDLYSQPALDEDTTDEELQQAIDDLLKGTDSTEDKKDSSSGQEDATDSTKDTSDSSGN